MARRRRSFFFDNINKMLLTNTLKNTSDIKDDKDNNRTNSNEKITRGDTQTLIDTEIAALANSAPATLNTLDELAAALGDDANFATTTATSLGNRLRIDTNAQSLTSTQKTNAVTNLGLATVATSGAYSDLTGTPTIPTNNNQLTNGAGYITGITSSMVTTALGYTPGTSSFSGSYNDLSNKPTIPTNNNQLTNGAGYQVASTWTSNATLATRSTGAPDTAGDSQGINAHYMNQSATNKPSGTDHSLLTMSYSAAWQTQIAADWRNSGRLYVRGQNNGTWSSWNTVWDSGNDGSGSGLDADLLDGQQGSYYAAASHNHSGVYTPYDHFRHTGHGYYTSTTTSALLTEALGDDAFDSKLTAHKTGWSYAGNGNLTDAGRLTELAGTSWLWWTDNSTDNVQGNITALCIAPNTGGSAGKVFIYNNQGSGYSPGWREVWTSASDGSGSGLDADLLDGLDLHTGRNNEANKVVRTQGNGYCNFGWINTTSGSAGTTAPDRIYASYDGYIRYYTPDNFKSVMSGRFITTDTTQATNIWIRNASPTIYFRDTNHRGAMLHNNSNLFYVLRGSQATDSTSWATTGAGWPLTINLNNNDATFGGNVTAYSDVRLKENIKPIDISIEQFKSIEAKRFDWKANGKHDVGFIAQDVEAAGLIEVVKEHEERDPGTGELIDTYKTLDYSRMVPFLWDIVQKQQAQIEELKEMIGGTPK